MNRLISLLITTIICYFVYIIFKYIDFIDILYYIGIGWCILMLYAFIYVLINNE